MRPLSAHRAVEIEDDVTDIGDDGKPVGSDIQHASAKHGFIERLILDQELAAAERCSICTS